MGPSVAVRICISTNDIKRPRSLLNSIQTLVATFGGLEFGLGNARPEAIFQGGFREAPIAGRQRSILGRIAI
jgi:hypothetical protein